MRRPISRLFIEKQSGRGPQIGSVPHPSEPNAGTAKRNEAQDKTEAVKAAVQALETILQTGLARDPHVGVGDWRREPTLADLPEDLRDLKEPDPLAFEPPPLALLEQLSPVRRARHARAVEEGETRFRQAVADWREALDRQDDTLAELRAETEAHNRRLADLEKSIAAGEPAAVEWYAAQVLNASPYPKRLERRVETGFDGKSRTLRVRIEIPPGSQVVPVVEAYKYVRGSDDIKTTERSPGEMAALYERVVAQLALRSLHEVFTTDSSRAIAAVALSLEVLGVDPATGHDTVMPLVSFDVSRQAFENIDLSRVEPLACLRRLAGIPFGEASDAASQAALMSWRSTSRST